MTTLIADLRHEFQRHKKLADRALAQLDDESFFHAPGAVNSVALIVKHLAGNFASRWTDFLTTDGEKPDRNRDGEFVLGEHDTMAELLDSWERGWGVLFDALAFRDFIAALNGAPGVEHAFLVTDSEDAFAEMTEGLGGVYRTHMLYRDYLRTFRILASPAT